MNPNVSKASLLHMCVVAQRRAEYAATHAQMYVMMGHDRSLPNYFGAAAMWQRIARMHSAVAIARLLQILDAQ